MTDAVAWALVHFVWQGALLGLASWLLQRLVRSPQARYITGVVTLAAMLVAFVWTTLNLVPARTAWVTTVTEIEGQFESASLTGHVIEGGAPAASGLPSDWIVALWALGLLTFATRAAGGWMLARRLTRVGVSPVAPWVLEQAQELSASMGITRSVRVLLSTRVPAPVLIGWIAPVILLPVTALTGLSSAQVSALLAHELAHVRRYDYLVNLLQTMVEAAFFFHPAVWLISRRVREDRELCCDDLAVQVCDRLTYVTALSTVASLRAAPPALAASGGALRSRIARLLGPVEAPLPRAPWVALVPVLLVLAAAMPVSSTSTTPTSAPQALATPESVPALETTIVAPRLILEDAPAQPRTDIVPPREVAQPAPQPYSVARPALPVALDYLLPAVNAAPLTEAPVVQQQAKAAEPVLHEVFVQGYVVRPGVRMVEANDSTVMRLIELSGGVNARAGDTVEVRNQRGEIRLELRLSDPTTQDVAVQSGETLFVRPAPLIRVSGDVAQQGLRRWSPGMNVSRGIAMSGGQLETGSQIEIRRARDGSTVTAGLDSVVEPDDEIMVRRQEPAQPTEFVEVGGEVNKPGKIAWKEGMTVGDAIRDAGGMTRVGKLGTVRRLEDKPDGSRVWVELKGSKMTLDTVLKPGDKLTIARKFWGGN